MSAFSQLKQSDGTVVDFERGKPEPVRRPSRWSPANWSVRLKVLAIVLLPLLLAGTFGGLRIYSAYTAETDLRRAAERADMVPAIADYMAALEDVMLAVPTGGDPQAALGRFDERRRALQSRLTDTDVAPDVRQGVTTLVDDGQLLVEKVAANSIGLRDEVQAYALLLLPAEDTVTGSVRVDDERIRAEAAGVARAIGARGQMTMQRLALTRGAELPEPELRTALTAVAGTEPSTLFGMSQVLGVGSADAQQLQAEFVKRMALLTDPAVPIANNRELLASVAETDRIARQVIDTGTGALTAAVEQKADEQRTTLIRDAAVVGAAILLALVIVALAARSLVRPLRRLRDSALKVAHEDLPREIEQVRAGGDAGQITPIPVHTSEEVGQVAHAVDELHEQAVLLAAEQARLQLQIGDMFETLSRRSRSLVDQQLALIDQLERNEEDPDRLQALFRLDHLAARMRRNGANLLVLSGAKVPREQAEPVPVTAVINAAASEVEDYARVVTLTVPDSEVSGAVAGDLVHLLAELLDNALRYSPPTTQVRVSAVHTGNGGLVIEVSDTGLGMTESDLRVANTRLQSGGEINPYTARHMGLFVVGRLAAQHGLVVRLRATVTGEPDSGTTAGVYVPAELLHRADEPEDPVVEVPIAVLPQRSPGASGITEVPASLTAPQPRVDEQGWPVETPTDTSGYFAARVQAEPEPEPAPAAEPEPAPAPEPVSAPEPEPEEDTIYQKMLSEWLVDPTELANSEDLNWQSVWDRGWSAAAEAEQKPVTKVTEEGLPVREPGARLVPGAADPAEVAPDATQVASTPEPGPLPRRDPDAVRASISSHFGGVRAGRSHAREQGTEQQ
ncbi:signal transduction histidine kinase [Mycolicibacterium phlei]|uniref:histidine kinase n=1 Tax=Mycolicibacterium phlei DSM 43239 = CCUG 21000 TaxID=1226750 RepID=A0A5N5V4L0_MYCPH|nr:sensor histidine kinase [Mycolicibacterium phlei]VEG08420.1 signal transduction histidine kinase [Mycobacteroides chelonae]AMO60300.1 Signal transduction histidine-protein kinase/phosphatase MprB [Mycolicibacterium phlei]KAB7756658.1 integral membrane sensor signal transduction histidine kinase [Mycolicibacterium phlei DSM 43239 = CCUG 21000]KXW63545.1 integral membrane sensor signal transduction histidine kinase [Mycolicibacterium phlei DSM 43239 = CCUG 21000]KXW66399.1 integral membrane s